MGLVDDEDGTGGAGSTRRPAARASAEAPPAVSGRARSTLVSPPWSQSTRRRPIALATGHPTRSLSPVISVPYHAAHALFDELRCITSRCRLWGRPGTYPESAARQVARRRRFHHDRLGQVWQQLQRPVGRCHRAFPTGLRREVALCGPRVSTAVGNAGSRQPGRRENGLRRRPLHGGLDLRRRHREARSQERTGLALPTFVSSPGRTGR